MTVEKEKVLEVRTIREVPLAERLFYAFQSRGLDGGIELSLPGDRQLKIVCLCVEWDALPVLPYLPEAEKLDFERERSASGLDSLFYYYLSVVEQGPDRGLSTADYSDKETVSLLDLLSDQYQWSLGIDGVIPADLEQAIDQALEQF